MMASTSITTTSHFNLKTFPYLPQHTSLNLPAQQPQQHVTMKLTPTNTKPRRRRKNPPSFSPSTTHFYTYPNDDDDGDAFFNLKSRPGVRSVLARARSNDEGGGGGGGAGFDATQQQQQQSTARDMEPAKHSSSSSFGDSYVALFVQMLGLDNDPLDREQAIVALWKYSLGGRKCIDNIMQFQGCINLTVNLLKSDSSSAREAAAGLLRSISSINLYSDLVAESGAIEEITGLLSQPSVASEVKEQSICTLWNLSADEKLRMKIANSDLVPLLIRFLEDKDVRVKEAAGGVLANLALTHSNHNIMVEAGVIPKLAIFLNTDPDEESKVIRKEARNVLVELAKNEYYRILVIEEGLVPVPLIGAAAYRSFTPALRAWPSLPDGTEIERTSKVPSRYGASELLLGLNIDTENASIEEAKMKAIIGRSKQQFLARSGAIEVEDKSSGNELSISKQFTILPWMDGVARLVLILELEDESAISRAAESIANASINEYMRNSFKEAGAVKHLVRLLDHNCDTIRSAVVCALERLSVSNGVCQVIEAEGVMSPLTNIIKNTYSSENMKEKALNLLARILDPHKEMKSKFYTVQENRSKKSLEGRGNSIGLTTKNSELSISNENTRQDVLDTAVISPLVEMLKHSSPDLQRKAASVLESLAIVDANINTIISVNIESGLEAVFKQKVLSEMDSDVENQQPELYALKVEEAGLAVSAACRLFAKLLDSEQFRSTINSTHLTKLLREILKSNIPLDHKEWVAACLVKLSSSYGRSLEFENPVNMEITLYETIPRLIEQISSSLSPETREAAMVELNRIISEGMVDATRAVASKGGIFPLVRLIDEGSERAVEAALSVLYNLSMDGENHPAILAAGAVPALRRIVLSQRPQWTRALHLLRTLPT